MPLENLGKDEQLNIKKVETPDLMKESTFSYPAELLDKEAVRLMVEFLKMHGTSMAVEIVGPLITLFPEIKEEVMEIDPGAEQLRRDSELRLREDLKKFAEVGLDSQELTIDKALGTRLTFPDWNLYQVEEGELLWTKLIEKLEELKKNLPTTDTGAEEYVQTAGLLYILIPSRKEELRLADYEAVKRADFATTGTSMTVHSKALMRILYPQIPYEQKDATYKRWFQGILRDQLKKRDFAAVAALLMQEAILSAGKVIMTEDGIELQPVADKKSFEKAAPPLPETKK